MTLRRALENSKNLVTARLLDGGIARTPEQSLTQVCELALEAQRLSGMHALLSVRARRPAGAADRSRRPSMPRSPTRAVARRRTRSSRSRRTARVVYKRRTKLRRRLGSADRGGVLSAPDHAAGRAGARHGPLAAGARALCWRQDRHQRRRERCLVRRLHATTSPLRSGSATTTPTASAARSDAARPAARSRLRSSNPSLGGLGAPCAEGPLEPSVAAGGPASHCAPDRS